MLEHIGKEKSINSPLHSVALAFTQCNFVGNSMNCLALAAAIAIASFLPSQMEYCAKRNRVKLWVLPSQFDISFHCCFCYNFLLHFICIFKPETFLWRFSFRFSLHQLLSIRLWPLSCTFVVLYIYMFRQILTILTKEQRYICVQNNSHV